MLNSKRGEKMGRVTVKGSGVGGGERSEDRIRRIFSSVSNTKRVEMGLKGIEMS